ncbi:MAG: glycosyltransferase [Bacteroidota bacterium]
MTHKPDVHFLIIGSGGNKEKLEKLVAKNNLNNIRFFPLVPNEKLPALLASADLHLVLQKKSASDLVMPSKLTGILAAGGRPVVTAEPGTSLYEMIETHKLGILVKPESPVELSRAIETALATDLSLYRQHARQYAVDYLSRDSIMKKFEMEIYSRLKKSPVLSYVPASHSPNHSNVLSIKKR